MTKRKRQGNAKRRGSKAPGIDIDAIPFEDVVYPLDPPWRESWADFFNRLDPLNVNDRPLPTADEIERTTHFWHTYPRRKNNARLAGDPEASIAQLGIYYFKAVNIITTEAERQGIPSDAVGRAALVCVGVSARLAGTDGFACPPFDSWPVCAKNALQGRDADDRKDVREAEGVISRLRAAIRAESQARAKYGHAADDLWQKPKWFQERGIDPRNLRAAVRSDKIHRRPCEGSPTQHEYSVADAQVRWRKKLPQGVDTPTLQERQ
jgi:hypothetical protein